MIAYFDTSALMPLLIEESSTPTCQTLWERSDPPITARISYVETVAAMAQAGRVGRLEPTLVEQVLQTWDRLWSEIAVVEIDETLATRAAAAAVLYQLRGYDAVQCAAGLTVSQSPECVMIAGDHDLLEAWGAAGASVLDVNA